MKPVIGIAPGIGTFENRGDIFPDGSQLRRQSKRRAGYRSCCHRRRVAELLGIVDGIFSGGADIRPDRYGDEYVHKKTYGISDLRDEIEFALLEAALRADADLAICRGISASGWVARSTSDVPTEYPDVVRHSQPWEISLFEHPIHDVTIERDSLIGDLLGTTTVGTSSAHHQSLQKRVAPGLRVVGRSSDQGIEAVELPDKRRPASSVAPSRCSRPTRSICAFAGLTAEAKSYKAQKALGTVAAD